MKNQKDNLFKTLISAALLSAPGVSFAEEEAIEEVVVKGYRASLQNSISAKRDASSIIEAISSEDIAGLPDTSIADALVRLPGITANRGGGEARDIQIRGLGDEFVFGTFKGREQVSPALRRTIEFNQYPSELISRVTVHKSPVASQVEGGVAGTVDFDITDPLDMSEKRRFSTSFRYSHNDQAGEVFGADEEGIRFTATYQEKFFEDRLGLSLGYARLDQPNATQQFIGGRPQASGDLLMPDEVQLYLIGGQEERDGYVSSIAFTPVDWMRAQLDLFYSEFQTDTNRNGFSINGLVNALGPNPEIVDGNVISGQYLGSPGNGESPNVRIVNGDVSDSDDIFSGGLNVEFYWGDWTAAIDFSRSEASGFNQDGFHYGALYEPATNTGLYPTGFQREDDEFLRINTDGVKIGNVALNQDYTNFNTLRLAQYGIYPRLNDDEVDALKLDFTWDIAGDVISSVQFGLRRSERLYNYRRAVFVYNDGSSATSDVDLAITPATGTVASFSGDYGHLPSFIAIDAEAIFAQAVANGGVLQSGRDINGDFNPAHFDASGQLLPRPTDAVARWGENRAWSMLQRGDVMEDVDAGYVQVNFDTDLSDHRVYGNIGIRVVETDQSSTGFVDVDGRSELGAVEICDAIGDCRDDFAIQTFGEKYTSYLPSLNISYLLTENDYLRFAAARVMSRPPINRLSLNQPVDGGGGVSIDTSDPLRPKFNYSNENSPFLRPFTANQIDLSYERYFEGDNGQISLALYHKDVRSFIQTLTIPNFDFSSIGFLLPETIPVEVGGLVVDVPLVNGDYTFAINNQEGGYIRGVEFTIIRDLDFLPGQLANLGVNFTFAVIDSEITVDNPFTADAGDSLPYPGLAEESGNFTLYYELERFEARLSVNYQSDKVGEIGTAFAANTVFDDETKVDLHLSYNFDNGVGVVLEGYNITDEPNSSYWGRRDLVGTIQNFGRQYYLGVTYAF